MIDIDYKKDLSINELQLENEWLTQASKYMQYAEIHATAVSNRDTAKVKLEYVSAQLDTEIRYDWEKHFDSKPTEVAIKNWVIQNKKYQTVQKELVKTNEEVNVSFGMKLSMDHKKLALQNLVQCKLSGFHAEPRNIHHENNIKNKQQEKVKVEQKKSINSTMKNRKRTAKSFKRTK